MRPSLHISRPPSLWQTLLAGGLFFVITWRAVPVLFNDARRSGPPAQKPSLAPDHNAAAQLRHRLATGNLAAIEATIRESPVDVWITPATALPLIEELASRHAQASPLPANFVAPLKAIVEKVDQRPEVRNAILTTWVIKWMSIRSLSEDELASILPSFARSDAVIIVSRAIATQKDGDLELDRTKGVATLQRAGFDIDEATDRQLALELVTVRAAEGYDFQRIQRFALKFAGTETESLLVHRAIYVSALTSPEKLTYQLGKIPPEVAAANGYKLRLRPQELKQLVKDLPPAEQQTFLKAYLAQVVRNRPSNVVGLMDAFSYEELTPELRTSVAATALCADVGALADWLKTTAAGEKALLLDNIYKQATSPSGPYYNIKPTEALTLSFLEVRLGVSPLDTGIVTQCISRLPNQDISKLLELIGRLPSEAQGAARLAAYQTRIQGLSGTNPSAIVELVNGSSPEIQASMAPLGFTTLYGADPEKAMAWWNEMKDPALKAKMARSLFDASSGFVNVTREQKETIFRALLQSSPQSEMLPIVSNMFRDLGAYAPKDGTRLLESIADPALKSEAIRVLTRDWAEVDPLAASEWIVEMQADGFRDVAARELIACSRDDPQIAFANARAISDPTLRKEAAKDIFEVWKFIDLNAAIQHAKLAGFSETELNGLGIRPQE